jgi:hypothetical protein
MLLTPFHRVVALTLIAPSIALLPALSPTHVRSISPVESAALQASFDPQLGSLRAGRADAPAPFSSNERASLRAAQNDSDALSAMRGGGGPTREEWTWIAVGTGVLILVLILV